MCGIAGYAQSGGESAAPAATGSRIANEAQSHFLICLSLKSATDGAVRFVPKYFRDQRGIKPHAATLGFRNLPAP